MGSQYGFTILDCLQLTKRQFCLYLKHAGDERLQKRRFWAKLHGFKMKAAPTVYKFNKKDDDRLKELANKRFEEMEARAQGEASLVKG